MAENAEENYIKSVSDKFTVDADGKLELKTLTTESIDGLANELNKKLEEDDLSTWVENNKDTLPGLFDSESKEKLDGIEAGAQKNLFDQVNDAQFEIAETDEGEKQLNIKEISVSQVTNLEALLNGKVDTKDFDDLEENVNNISATFNGINNSIEGINNSIEAIETKVTNLETAMNDYVTYDVYNTDKEVIMKSITWTSLDTPSI